jgi:hypothetical protein
VTASSATGARYADRHKLFTRPELREEVLRTLGEQLVAQGRCRPRPKVGLGLATGHIASAAHRTRLEEECPKRSWLLLTDEWLEGGLRAMAETGYDNEVGVVAAKLLLRGG